MAQIDIDFEVYKELTNRRSAESVTYNDVIRELLRLPKSPSKGMQSAAAAGRPWVVSNTSFPAGSEFMADYKGTTYTGVVKDGKLEINGGGRFTTPSAAAVSITHGNVNGWRFWKCKLPGASHFLLIERLRGKAY